MRICEVVFSRDANVNFDNTPRFIARDNPHQEIGFVDELQQRAVEILSTVPRGGRNVGENRYIALDRRAVVYEIDDRAALVRAILVTEGHRDRRAAPADR